MTVLIGGIIPEADIPGLKKAGIAEVFLPGTTHAGDRRLHPAARGCRAAAEPERGLNRPRRPSTRAWRRPKHDRNARHRDDSSLREKYARDDRAPHRNQERRGTNPPGRRRESHRSAAQERPPHGARAHRQADRSRIRSFSSWDSTPPTKCTRNGAARRPRARSPGLARVCGPARDDHRQRRHREGRRVFPDDREESDPRAEYRHRESHPDDLSGRFRRSFSAAAGGCLPRHRRFRPRLPQQRRDERDGHPADHRHHGHVRGGRRVFAGDVRPHPDDRRQRAVSRRSGAGAGGHRPENVGGGIGRRANARADQRHGGFPRAGRRSLPRAHPRAGRQNGPSAGARRSTTSRPSRPRIPPKKFTASFPRARQAIRHARNHRAHRGRAAKFDEYRAEYGQTVLCGYARIGGWAVGIVANQKKHVKSRRPAPAKSESSSAA